VKNRVFVLLLAILIWELVVLYLATRVSALDTIKYQLAARYSARTSFVIVIAMLLWTGVRGLKSIYSSEESRKMLMLLLLAFAFNHFIHFIYLWLNHEANNMELLSVRTSFGTLEYVLLSLAPFYLWNKKTLTKSLHAQLAGFFLIVVGIFSVTYSGRFSKPVYLSSPLFFYQLCLALIAVCIILNGYRFFKERREL